PVPLDRHCERSEAIQSGTVQCLRPLDCRVAASPLLAMTIKERGVIISNPLLCRVFRFEARDEFFLPLDRRTDGEREKFRAAIVELAVGFPCVADAAMGLDVFLR